MKAPHNMKLKLTKQPVTPFADANDAPERLSSLAWCCDCF